jgi:hypothetical protein
MLARCARCQGTFTTDRFGRQTCPHCGSELDLAAPSAPPAAPPSGEAPPPLAPPGPPRAGTGGELPPPPPPPPGGYGPPSAGGGYGGPPPGGPGGPGGYGPDLPAPFAERATRGLFGSFFETWKLVATEPLRFFSRVRVDQTGSAVLFGVIASTVGGLVQGLTSWASGRQSLAAMERALGDMPPETAALMRRLMELFAGPAVLVGVVLAPVLAVVGIYLIAGILHLLLTLVRGAGRGFDATLTTVGYAYGLHLLVAVPGCGGLIAIVWFAVALVIGLGAAQRCGPGKAAAAVFAPLLLACACCCAALGLGGFAAFREAAGHAQQGVNL